MIDRSWSRVILAAIGLYFIFGFLLIVQKPGLHYDEAQLAAGAVHLLHSHAETTLAHAPNSWICLKGRCLPLMAQERYIGAIKEYVCWPLFALVGPRTWLIRVISLMFGAIGIWGIGRFVAQQASPWAGSAAALLLAVHPAYINMNTFDNGAVGAMMAALGLLCATLASYLNRRTATAAFWLGAAAGFGVWTRANFVWMLIAGTVAAVLVFRRRILIPLKHWLGIALGGIVGGFPFLLYQAVSRGGTWEAVSMFEARGSMRELVHARLFMFADTLLSDGEHRVMWGTRVLPDWQLWLFPILVVTSCLVSLLTFRAWDRKEWTVARFTSLAFLFLGMLLFSTRVQITEHHLIALVPLAVVVVVLSVAVVLSKFRWSRIITACIGVVYVGSALYWQVSVMQGLKTTGGIGVWSDAVLDVAKQLDQQYAGREVTVLDWGLQQNIYVLTNGRLQSHEIAWDSGADPNGGPPRPWMDLIQDGGVFLLHGPEDRSFPAASEQFLRTLDAARPLIHRYAARQRNGATYAQIIDVEPNSVRGSPPQDGNVSAEITMSDSHAESQLTGFYAIEEGSWRWTKPQFSVLLKVPDGGGDKVGLTMRVFIPEISVRTLGALTLSGHVGGQKIAEMVYRNAGPNVFKSELPIDKISPGPTRFDFEVDKHLGPNADDSRLLGIVVTSAAVELK